MYRYVFIYNGMNNMSMINSNISKPNMNSNSNKKNICTG